MTLKQGPSTPSRSSSGSRLGFLREGVDGPCFSVTFAALPYAQARFRPAPHCAGAERWGLSREGALLKRCCYGDRTDLRRIDRMRLFVERIAEEPVEWEMTEPLLCDTEPERLDQPLLPLGPLVDEMGQARFVRLGRQNPLCRRSERATEGATQGGRQTGVALGLFPLGWMEGEAIRRLGLFSASSGMRKGGGLSILMDTPTGRVRPDLCVLSRRTCRDRWPRNGHGIERHPAQGIPRMPPHSRTPVGTELPAVRLSAGQPHARIRRKGSGCRVGVTPSWDCFARWVSTASATGRTARRLRATGSLTPCR